jgi:hypothetical protein
MVMLMQFLAVFQAANGNQKSEEDKKAAALPLKANGAETTAKLKQEFFNAI